MYNLVAMVSFIIRQFCLPNPFEPLCNSVTIELTNITIPVGADLLNWFIAPILHSVTFVVVGMYYRRGENNPLMGSLLYFVFYCIHTAMIYAMSDFNFSKMSMFAIAVVYIFIHIGINAIRNKLNISGL